MNLSAPFDPAIGWHITLALFHVSWLGLAIGGLVTAGNWCMREAPASRRHGLSFGALLALGLSLPASLAYVRLTAPRSTEILPAASLASSVSTAAASAPLSNRVESLSHHVPAWFDLRANSQTIAIVYLLGVAAMLAKLGMSIYGGQRLLAACRPVADPRLLEMVARQCQLLGLGLVPVVGCCQRVAVPVVLGLVRPMILLPAAMLTGLDAEQLAAVLTHELAHIRRHDHLLIIVQRLVEALLFFHPAVWYLSRCVQQERENCCDDLVLAAGGDRIAYCFSLLRVAELRLAGEKRREQLTVLAVDGEQPSSLRRRIARLLGVAGSQSIPLTRAGLLVVALMAILCAGVYFSLVHSSRPDQAEAGVKLVAGHPGAIAITRKAMDSLGIRLETVKAAPPITIRCDGSLFIDPNRLVHVQTRWRGEVLKIGPHAVEGEPPAGEAPQRNLRFGDRVKKGDLLAIVFTDEPDENKKAPAGDRPPQAEIRAPIDGVIVEKNINVGDIADPTLDLFKIADLSQLEVLAHVLEEDLPMLEDLPEQRRHWNIWTKTYPQGKPLSGSFSLIGNIVDPNRQTALVMGWVDNAAGLLRVGQFVTATIELPADSSLVVVPGSALIGGEGDLAAVFVETNDEMREFMRRRARIRRRDGTSVFINRQPTDDERKHGFETLHAGERVIVSGVRELAAELKNAR